MLTYFATHLIPVLLHRSEIDDAKWDAFLSSCRQDVIYARSFYLDIISPDWKALVCYQQTDYQVVMPLPVKCKWGISVIIQPFFCQYLGIFSKNSLTQEDYLSFLSALSSHFPYISSYHFNPENFEGLQEIQQGFEKINFTVRRTHWLDLSESYPQICQHYSRDRRSNLKRSSKFQWEIVKGANIDPLIDLFAAHHAHQIKGGVNTGAYALLKTIFESTFQRGISQVWYAQKDGLTCAGILILESNGRAIYLFNAANNLGRKTNARTRMLDAYFSQNAGKNITFDFESPEIKPVAGFYRSFGSKEIPYLKITKNQLGFPWRQIQNWRKWYFLKTR